MQHLSENRVEKFEGEDEKQELKGCSFSRGVKALLMPVEALAPSDYPKIAAGDSPSPNHIQLHVDPPTATHAENFALG